MSTPLVIYSLQCSHAVSGPATLVSGTLYCPWHDERSQISGVIVYEWRAKCDSCRYARWAGASKDTASIFIKGHYRRNPGHSVHPEYTINPVSQATADKFKAWNAVRTQ
jgi:hypothetical protein